MDNQILGVAISLDRAHTAVVAAGRLGDGVTVAVEVAAYFDGTDNAASVAEIAHIRGAARVVVDPRSPAATILAPLRLAGLNVLEPGPHDLAVAHGLFLDELRAGRLRYRDHPALTAAVQFAALRPLAGAEALDRRRTEADASPLEAAELACWGVATTRMPQIHVFDPNWKPDGSQPLPQPRRPK